MSSFPIFSLTRRSSLFALSLFFLTSLAEAGVEGGIIGGKGKEECRPAEENNQDCVKSGSRVLLPQDVYHLTVEGLKEHDTVYVVIRGNDGYTVLTVTEKNGRIVDAFNGTEILPQ